MKFGREPLPRPLLQAEHAFLTGWHPSVVLPDGHTGIVLLEVARERWSVYRLSHRITEHPTSELRLDPRFPEVEDRVARVWFGASGLFLAPHGALAVGGRVVAVPWVLDAEPGADAFSPMWVPELARLPQIDAKAHALVAVGRRKAELAELDLADGAVQRGA